jgi:hypothetical protein
MKTRIKSRLRRFQLELLGYGNSYYIERVGDLERALAKKPRRLQIDLVGVGEISADAALRIRAALLARSPRTEVVTYAHSSLVNGSLLVWLLGDQRKMRDDATAYIRRANLVDAKFADLDEPWNEEQSTYRDSYSEFDPEEADYARVLQLINEFLPIRELVGRIIRVPVLRQFGLVECEKVDNFLANVLAKKRESADEPPGPTEGKSARDAADISSRRHLKR